GEPDRARCRAVGHGQAGAALQLERDGLQNTQLPADPEALIQAGAPGRALALVDQEIAKPPERELPLLRLLRPGPAAPPLRRPSPRAARAPGGPRSAGATSPSSRSARPTPAASPAARRTARPSSREARAAPRSSW